MTRIAGIILAGGESRRFGSPKAFALYKEKPLFQYSLEALKANVHDIIIISNPKLKERFSNYPVYVMEDDEEVRGRGPLAGLYTAMNHVQADWYFVLPCDVPKINGHVVRDIIEKAHPKYEAVIPVVNGKVQPLIGLYSAILKKRITQQLLTDNYRMLALLERSNVKYVAYEKCYEIYFINVNDQRSYSNLKQHGE